MTVETPAAATRRKESHREFLAGAVIGAAALMIAWMGGRFLVAFVEGQHGALMPNGPFAVAIILNIALIMLGWLRYRSLSTEVQTLTVMGKRAELLEHRDPPTGLLNRRSFGEHGAALLTRGQARRKALAVIVLDIDNFRSVNDLHGHATGDILLRLIGDELSGTLPGGALAARLGGDEFACAFLFDAVNPDAAERTAERIVLALGRPFHAEGVDLNATASVGIARSDLDGHSIAALIRAAEMAMYAAKTAGRNRHVWFDQSMERALLARNTLEQGLRTAIPHGEIVPYFEQQIELGTGRLVGFEVLARWEHPTQGLIAPDRFIAIAEETGLIGELSLSIMRQAFLAARDWAPALTLSINISPIQLRDAWLSQKIIKVLTETGFPASRLEVEITESSLFENLPLAQSIVGSLKNQGIRIALDDFGTGYSSLAHLCALPFDRIKIDKSFVASILDKPDSAAIVNAIAKLGESLNLPVTAEGVEDSRTEERLRAIGCTKAQGYLYGRPLSVTHARRLLAETHLLAFPSATGAPPSAASRPSRIVG